jgi:tetratricopeptide (TPR) repeat protein
MEQHPDSAMILLSTLDKDQLSGDRQKAKYALLMSIALDKNYIDTTSFDVLQPAIDYYLKKGSPDEQLRTYYYQGVIYMNRSDFDMAMQCYLKAVDLKDEYSDTLTYANMLVSQGYLYAKSNQTEDYVNNNLYASELYGIIGQKRRKLSSLIRALDGCVSLGNKPKSDSIMSVTDSLVQISPESSEALLRVKMTYGIRFDSDSVINKIFDSFDDFSKFDDETKLDISLGYLKIKQPQKAKIVFESIDMDTTKNKSFRYLSIKPNILEANNEYKEALAAYKNFHTAVESENSKIYSQKTTVAQDLHKLKIKQLNFLHRKNQEILLAICFVLVLISVICIIYYKLRLGKIKSVIAEQKKTRLQLENENLHKHNSVLELAKHNADLERDKQKLASENMSLKISQLELEGEQLKDLLKKAELSKPILDSIQERIEILNGLLAAKISDNNNYSKPYDKWINQVTEDRKSFMDSTRLAFRASHPALMKYLDEHGLNESELNYVCLYAIGLRGKEIGEYIQIKRHYHTSTDIRKKLGLNEDDTNLGIHIRKLMKKL